jgi:hypothetical protein
MTEMGQVLISWWGGAARIIAIAAPAPVLPIPSHLVESVIRERDYVPRGLADIITAWNSDNCLD